MSKTERPPSADASAADRNNRARKSVDLILSTSSDLSGDIANAEALHCLFSSFLKFDVVLLAVSGGSDSMAMLNLVGLWLQHLEGHDDEVTIPVIEVASVDHQLRAASREEVKAVADHANELQLPHHSLCWSEKKPTSGVQEAAREVRYRLFEELTQKRHPGKRVAIATAHTRDDQVETFLMRLARGSGLDGLTGMATQRPISPLNPNVHLKRPLLDVSKADLTHFLKQRGITWHEDPSNQDQGYERVRWRENLRALEAIGLTKGHVALSISRLARAQDAIDEQVKQLAVAAQYRVGREIFGSFQLSVWQLAAAEVQQRFLVRLIAAFGGQTTPVRLSKVEHMVGRLMTPTSKSFTLGGCLIKKHRGSVLILREPARADLPIVTLKLGEPVLWDHRFRVELTEEASRMLEVTVKALGNANPEEFPSSIAKQLSLQLEQCNKDAAATLPSFWARDELLAVPQLNVTNLEPGLKHISQSCLARFAYCNLFDQTSA